MTLGICGTECGWRPDQTFVCAECTRTVCYCCGCADDLGDICDDCASKHICRDPKADPDHDRCEPCCRRAQREDAEHHAEQNREWAENLEPVFDATGRANG